MKIKSLIGIFPLLALLFSACDDDLNTIGGSVQPKDDDIVLTADTMLVKARTISMEDSIYARTIYGLLGKYDDEIFGSIKSDYLCEFYCPDDTKFDFSSGYRMSSVDSTRMQIAFSTYSGDTIAPMGVSIYEVNNRLAKNYYTNLDVSKYCDLSKPLGAKAYTIAKTPFSSSTTRVISVDMADFGKKLYNASLTANSPLKNSSAFLDYFPGAYIESSFGAGNLVQVDGTSLRVFYTARKDTVLTDSLGVTRDSIMYLSKVLSLSVTAEVIQLNKVQNRTPASLLVENTGATYIKSPAGLCTEVELPLKDIIDKAGTRTVNLARFKVSGFTEKEPSTTYALKRTQNLLLINKDSVESFFTGRKPVDYVTTFVVTRSSDSNVYDFTNIGTMVKHYKEKGLTKNPKFLLIPVDLFYGSTYYNSMTPSTAILRAGSQDMRVELIYSEIKNPVSN